MLWGSAMGMPGLFLCLAPSMAPRPMQHGHFAAQQPSAADDHDKQHMSWWMSARASVTMLSLELLSNS